MRFSHINIKAPLPALHKEKEFCCAILGFTEGFRPDFSSKGYWLYYENEPLIHLTEGECEATQSQNGGFINHVAFFKENKDAFIALLKEKKIPYSSTHVSETKSTQVKLLSPLQVSYEIIFNDT